MVMRRGSPRLLSAFKIAVMDGGWQGETRCPELMARHPRHRQERPAGGGDSANERLCPSLHLLRLHVTSPNRNREMRCKMQGGGGR